MTKIMILCAMMMGCAVDAPRAATDDQGLVCDPNCDPGNFQALMSAMVGAASGLGSPLGPLYCHVTHGYDDNNDPVTWNECENTYQDPWSQRYFIDCADRLGSPNCFALACGQTGQPSC